MKHLLIFLILCASVLGATFTSTGAGNWNADIWGKGAGGEGVNYPGNGDTVILAHDVVANIARIPATGTLGLVTNVGAGELTLAVDTCTSVNAVSFDSAGGTDILHLTGARAAALTITGNLIAGDDAGEDCLAVDAVNLTVTVNGNVTGGDINTSDGITLSSTGSTVTVTGEVAGGGDDSSGPGINVVQPSTLTIGTLVFADASGLPLSGSGVTAITITTVKVNGTALGTSSSGTTGALYKTLYGD